MGGVCTAFLLGFSMFPLIQQEILAFGEGGIGEAVNKLYLLFSQKRLIFSLVYRLLKLRT